MFTRKLKLQTPLKSQLLQSSYSQKKNNSTPPPNQPANDRWSICQICDKKGHDALDYYHRFDFFFRDGFHLVILLQWLLKSTILMTNMSGIYGQWSKCSYHYQCRKFNQKTVLQGWWYSPSWQWLRFSCQRSLKFNSKLWT